MGFVYCVHTKGECYERKKNVKYLGKKNKVRMDDIENKFNIIRRKTWELHRGVERPHILYYYSKIKSEILIKWKPSNNYTSSVYIVYIDKTACVIFTLYL